MVPIIFSCASLSNEASRYWIFDVTPTLSPSLERGLRSDQAISRKVVAGAIETQNLNVIRKLAKGHRFRAFRVAKWRSF